MLIIINNIDIQIEKSISNKKVKLYTISMELLIDDVIIYVMTFLNNEDKIQFLSMSNKLHTLKHKVYYDQKIAISKIRKLPYYDMFTNVSVNNNRYALPKSVKKYILTRISSII